MQIVSVYAVPLVMAGIVIAGLWRKVGVFDCFVEGAKTGMQTIIQILPPMIGLLVAIGMLKASGTVDILVGILSPLTNAMGVPPQIVPLAVMRPISGSGAMAIAMDNLNSFGADSFLGRLTSVLMGSTETTLYTIAIYYGAIGIKNTRHTLKSALVADLAGVFAAVWACRLFFKI